MALQQITRPDLSYNHLLRLYKLAAAVHAGGKPDDSEISSRRIVADKRVIGSVLVEKTGLMVQLSGLEKASVGQLHLSVTQAILIETNAAQEGTSTAIKMWQEQAPRALAPAKD